MQNIVLILGRPGSGKSEQLISYANVHKDETLFISFENDATKLYNDRHLDTSIKVINSIDNVCNELTDSYTTICIDYLELISNFDSFKEMLLFAHKNRIRVNIASQLKRDFQYSPVAKKLIHFLSMLKADKDAK